jgi:SAM-dependent methyltransferase
MSLRTPLPPPDLIALVGGGDYNRVGRHMARLLRRVGGLRPEHRLLDVGCGCGRVAVHLTGFLTNGYEGFDVHQPHIDWCRDNLSPEFPLFSFRTMDIRNSHYNLHGQVLASEMSLPYPDASFDFVCAISLFTHMLEDGLRRYLSEIRRVLRPGGTLFATHFLVNRYSSQPPRRRTHSTRQLDQPNL